ncbi:hypothetical protein [Brevundimonas sp. R86498]
MNPGPARSIPTPEQEHPMLALGIIIGFVVVIAAINAFEFGRVD